MSNWNESYLYRSAPKDLRKECLDMLMESMSNPYKVSERENLLQDHPEYRLTVDTEKLKVIIDYDDFKCHPKCSIAKNRAIKGSDIDAGVVVLKEPVSEETELAFIEELRRQGFEVYHQKEYEASKEEYERTNDLSLINVKNRRDSRIIHFYTKAQLEEMVKQNPFDIPDTMVYLAGTSIR